MTTQFAKASYQEIIDLHTESDRVSVIGIHTPASRTPIHMLRGFFDAFQKFHYDGASLALVPAARLPADPLQVSYEAGETQQYIDPRDMLNPILWHGCHGNDMGSILNQFYSGDESSNLTEVDRLSFDSGDLNNYKISRMGNETLLEGLYYRALTDNSWAKAHPQRGFRKNGLRPLVYDISTNMQFGANVASTEESDYFEPSQDVNHFGMEGSMGAVPGSGQTNLGVNPMPGLATASGGNVTTPYNHSGQAFFTHRLKGLGWMDTRQVVVPGITGKTTAVPSTEDAAATALSNHFAKIAEEEKYVTVPKLFMGMILLPPAYATEQYFRLVINHRFSFRKFRGVSMRPNADLVGGTNYVYKNTPNVFNFN